MTHAVRLVAVAVLVALAQCAPLPWPTHTDKVRPMFWLVLGGLLVVMLVLVSASQSKLRDYRQALITAAVTGQLDIEEAA
jgi:hypothetical protein